VSFKSSCSIIRLFSYLSLVRSRLLGDNRRWNWLTAAHKNRPPSTAQKADRLAWWNQYFVFCRQGVLPPWPAPTRFSWSKRRYFWRIQNSRSATDGRTLITVISHDPNNSGTRNWRHSEVGCKDQLCSTDESALPSEQMTTRRTGGLRVEVSHMLDPGTI